MTDIDFSFHKMVWAIVVGNLMTGVVVAIIWVVLFGIIFG